MLTLGLGLVLGAAFGALLQLSGASSHTKIINALRLKDLTIMKLILTAIHERRLLRFSYHGKDRIVEPHDYGIQKDVVNEQASAGG